jgi:pimeloyl-ACP methyl ester carboxylesterase
MPLLERPEGVKIAWRERGAGPLVVISHQFFGDAEVFVELIADLTRDHRLVTYDLRGAGDSSRQGPYDFETDAADLDAVIEAAGPPALLLAMADGVNRAVRVAASRPDLATAIVSPAGNPVGRQAVEGTDALAGSDSVLDALIGMMTTDYRGALRTMFSTANPDWEEDRVKQRVVATVERLPQEAALARIKAWIADNVVEEARSLGDRLWILESGSNPWFPIEVSRNTSQFLPDAHVIEVEGGAISRPEITAGYIRRLTSAGEVVVSEGRERAL